MSSFNLRIITPEGVQFDQPINSLETTTFKGRIGIYANHVNLIALLKPNVLVLKVKNNQKEEYIVTSGSLFFENNEARIITQNFIDLKKVDVNAINNEIAKAEAELKKYEADSLSYKMVNQRIINNKKILEIIKK